VQSRHHRGQVGGADPDLGLVGLLTQGRGELVGERLLEASLQLSIRL